MKILAIHTGKENLQLSRPYSIAFKTVDSVENGIITIQGEKGLRGLGTFNPSYEVVGEKLQDALDVLSEENLQWLIGMELDNIESLCRMVQVKFASSTTARTGLEIALYDLYTQSIGVPLATYLGQKIFSMPTSITIGIKNVSETLAEAAEYTGRAFKILKIKLGRSPEEDVERLVKLREVYGFDIDLIIDANQGYDLEQFKIFCDLVSDLDIKLIEQPLKKGQEEMLRPLPGAIKQLIAADESLLTPADALVLSADPPAVGCFNIKLMKCGGISQALAIAEIANNRDIGLMWGCNDESIVSITAALHTAFTRVNTRFIDLDGSLDLAIDIVREGFILEKGMMSLPGKPGLGLTYLQ